MQRIATLARAPRRARGRDALRVRPKNAEQIAEVLLDSKRFPSPVRPVGANSGNPRCTQVQDGTELDMTGMNRLIEIRSKIVTVQAGMRLRDLTRELAEHGLELTVSFEEPDRTIGGLISSGALSVTGRDADGGMASSVVGLRVVTPEGRALAFDARKPEILMKLRGSQGLVGVIYQVTLRVRRIAPYTVRSRKTDFAALAGLLPELSASPAGVKIYLLPFRDRAYVELRENALSGRPLRARAWRVRDWLGNKLLPDLVHWLGRAIPLRRLRGPVIDGFSEATQLLVNTRLTDAGSNAMEQTGRFRRVGPTARTRQCCWYFPAERFGALLYAYREFARRYDRRCGYRCDLPAVALRVDEDSQSLLSPCFAGPMFALNLRTTVVNGWDDFLLDFAELAARFDGIPVFNQTRGFTAAHVHRAYGARLQRFRMMRRRADPRDRMLNQYFAEFMS